MHETVLSIDPGAARIGLAIGNTEMCIVTPLDCIIKKTTTEQHHYLQQTIKEWQVNTCLIGFPFPQQKPLKKIPQGIFYAIQIADTIKMMNKDIPLRFINEAYSSAAATYTLKQRQALHKNNKQDIDTYVACLLLQAYFDGENTFSYAAIQDIQQELITTLASSPPK